MKRNSKGLIIEFIFITLVGVISASLFANYLGQDMGPDLVNYHFYSGYLALHKSRLLTDIIPANIQTYLNPYIYVPYYLLYKIFILYIYDIEISPLPYSSCHEQAHVHL